VNYLIGWLADARLVRDEDGSAVGQLLHDLYLARAVNGAEHFGAGIQSETR
jgi:hypothetical protein